ncbi:MAG: lytic murein transglycosylase, partial [Patescibacteria group bacterium]
MRKFLIFIITVAIALPSSFVNFAEAETACTSEINGKSRSQLETELEACNKEIELWTETLNKTKADSASFARDVAVLTAKINAAQANIKSKNIAISNLSKDIAVKQNKIIELDTRLSRGRRSVADILRKTNEIDSYSLAEAILSGEDFSEFFADLDSYASTEEALQILFEELRGTKRLTEAEKAELNRKKQAEAEAKAAMEAAKREVEIANNEKKNLLAISQNKEKTYAQVLADRQAKAAQIRQALFPLRDAGAIPFGTALQYAQTANEKTGVASALILAILQQESNLGANVGSCVITDINSGSTKSINSGTVFSNGIHPTRDLPLLQSLLNTLGRDPYSTKVSCPVSHTFGYGGAMGPAQFIPSTWQLMENKVGKALGKDIPDPWNPSDAIMAMSLFLKDIMGTTGDSYTDQRTAACRYYSGQPCYPNGRAGKGLSYGNQVMTR